MRQLASLAVLAASLALAGDCDVDCNINAIGGSITALVDGVPAHDIDPIPVGTEVEYVAALFVPENFDDLVFCGIEDGFVTLTLPDGTTAGVAVGAVCPGKSTAATPVPYTVTAADVPVAQAQAFWQGFFFNGQFGTVDLGFAFFVVASPFASECPGDKDGDGDADVDDLLTVVTWYDMFGVDALLEVLTHWGCDA
jgi:hypothetical protein